MPTRTTQSSRESKWPRHLMEEVGLLSIPRGLIGEVGLAAKMSEKPGICHDNNIQQVIGLQDKILEDSY